MTDAMADWVDMGGCYQGNWQIATGEAIILLPCRLTSMVWESNRDEPRCLGINPNDLAKHETKPCGFTK